MKTLVAAALFLLNLCALAPSAALAADGGACPRPDAGSEAASSPDIYSVNGKIDVKMNYFTSMDSVGRTLFCFVTSDGKESPTFHVNPGDRIKIHLTNTVPSGLSEIVSNKETSCGSPVMTLGSVNMHFHGTNTSPRCHSDEVIHTLINFGETFDYDLRIPKDEPPGLYWYHPHVHGISSPALQGGATGAIEVEGMANIQPAVAGLPERYLVLRDQQLGRGKAVDGLVYPFWDVSVNYVPVSYPAYTPSIIKMQNGKQEFWRVVNAGANTILHLQVLYDRVPQPLQIVALDGVPTGSKDGRHQGTIVTQKDALLPPSSRVEFIVAPPASTVKKAQLVTLGIVGGPASDVNPYRPLANIVATAAPTHLHKMPGAGRSSPMRFDDLANAKVTAKRHLYFSEYFKSFDQHAEAADFFITVKGQKETLFRPNLPPAITTNQGAVEEWTIENQTQEIHEFHMHQIHFLVEEVNGVKIPKEQQQLYDIFQVPFWPGPGTPFTSIKVKLDFRGPDVGDFVYHCHILDHEDFGMMAIIRVLPADKKRGDPAPAKTSMKQAAVISRPAHAKSTVLAAR